eukprot:15340492-Ditylum_brightwellii.AAC.1
MLRVGNEAGIGGQVVFWQQERALIALTSLILVEKVTLLVHHLRSNSSVGKQIQIMLDWAQNSAGTQKSVLEDTRDLPQLEGSWLPHLHRKLKKIIAYITVLDTWAQKQHQVNDKHIIDVLLNSPEVSDNKR